MLKRKPEWMRVKISNTKHLNMVKKVVSQYNLNTVCEAANCPNRLECYSNKTATFMILGNICTRSCKFCNVTDGTPRKVDLLEPEHVAKAVSDLNLEHVVITSVTRDDLDDQGSTQFIRTINEIKKLNKNITIEILTPDFNGNTNILKEVVKSAPDVFNHNIETVKRLYDKVRPEADYLQSLKVLKDIKTLNPDMITKSGIMLGLGETKIEVLETLNDLKDTACDIVTIGQYLQPSDSHIEMIEYIHPDVFKEYEDFAIKLGFKAVASSPLVRSSYNASESVKKIKAFK